MRITSYKQLPFIEIRSFFEVFRNDPLSIKILIQPIREFEFSEIPMSRWAIGRDQMNQRRTTLVVLRWCFQPILISAENVQLGTYKVSR